MTDLRKIVSDALAAHGWSQSELARRSGVSQPQINRFLAGAALGSDALGSVLDALGVRVRAPRVKVSPSAVAIPKAAH